VVEGVKLTPAKGSYAIASSIDTIGCECFMAPTTGSGRSEIAHVLDEFSSEGATISFQLCGGDFSSPCLAMKAANACTP
jgi:hypothetical protein